MKKKKFQLWSLLQVVLVPVIVVVVLLFFFTALSNLDSGKSAEGRDQLEASIRQAAVACYAAEGVYPPDVAYLQEHYGLQIDTEHYAVFYDVFAQNLMPDITVLEKES